MVVNELASVQEVIMVYIGSLSQKSRNSDYLQELYRFSQWCGPDKQIDKVVLGSAGWYTFLNNEPFPYGIRNMPVERERYMRAPITLTQLLGARFLGSVTVSKLDFERIL